MKSQQLYNELLDFFKKRGYDKFEIIYKKIEKNGNFDNEEEILNFTRTIKGKVEEVQGINLNLEMY